ncbi:HK97-gp10 family putative phage morphogenesis protein [Sinorhizobium meliloti]|uniref:HK97-gp10 family putative phage morphogenesis protein n=1 Tax=Rhizobium meliloti TaxID=382 RepID=UPI00238035DF|nr:HK97-gp10 family putative phage morphogenesis protein [Sinorhizobium meliloti]
MICAPGARRSANRRQRSAKLHRRRNKAVQAAGETARKEFKNDKASAEVFVGAGPVPHAHLQEFGTSRHGPQPFARPAWDAGKNQVLDTIKDELAVQITKARSGLRARRQGWRQRAKSEMEEAITALLSGVAGGRRFWTRAPQKQADGSAMPRPYVVLFRIDGVPSYHYQGRDLISSRIQANCYSDTFTSAKADGPRPDRRRRGP